MPQRLWDKLCFLILMFQALWWWQNHIVGDPCVGSQGSGAVRPGSLMSRPLPHSTLDVSLATGAHWCQTLAPSPDTPHHFSVNNLKDTSSQRVVFCLWGSPASPCPISPLWPSGWASPCLDNWLAKHREATPLSMGAKVLHSLRALVQDGHTIGSYPQRWARPWVAALMHTITLCPLSSKGDGEGKIHGTDMTVRESAGWDSVPSGSNTVTWLGNHIVRLQTQVLHLSELTK